MILQMENRKFSKKLLFFSRRMEKYKFRFLFDKFISSNGFKIFLTKIKLKKTRFLYRNFQYDG